jgi:hypothetical protein
MFTEPLPSSGHMRHSKFEMQCLFNEIQGDIPDDDDDDAAAAA